jgi:DNA replication protein DnaC
MDFDRCPALNLVPSKKVSHLLETINYSNEPDEIKFVKTTAINRYATANIPMEYWNLTMEKDFTGSKELERCYISYVSDLKQAYMTGRNMCLAGQHGVAKTMSACCILKTAAQKGYQCLYTDLSSVIGILTQNSFEDKTAARRELNMIDFLVIDEVDPRFFAASDASTELYAKIFENILRTRRQNTLPTIVCTNSPNIVESFKGALKQSLASLFADKMEMVIVVGSDFRKENK